MKNKELFDKTIDILAKSYISGELNPMCCAACAVGNLIAGNNNYRVASPYWLDESGNTVAPSWKGVPYSGQIKSTGYSREEIANIESRFMYPSFYGYPFTCSCVESKSEKMDERNFYGFMAVVDYLSELHELDLNTTEEAKQKFVKA